jgi:hypothetical protein
MAPTVLAGFVKIENMMGMLDGSNPIASAFKHGDQFFNKRGLTGLRSTDNADHLRHSEIPALLF